MVWKRVCCRVKQWPSVATWEGWRHWRGEGCEVWVVTGQWSTTPCNPSPHHPSRHPARVHRQCWIIQCELRAFVLFLELFVLIGNRPIIGRLFGTDNRPVRYRCIPNYVAWWWVQHWVIYEPSQAEWQHALLGIIHKGHQQKYTDTKIDPSPLSAFVRIGPYPSCRCLQTWLNTQWTVTRGHPVTTTCPSVTAVGTGRAQCCLHHHHHRHRRHPHHDITITVTVTVAVAVAVAVVLMTSPSPSPSPSPSSSSV